MIKSFTSSSLKEFQRTNSQQGHTFRSVTSIRVVSIRFHAFRYCGRSKIIGIQRTPAAIRNRPILPIKPMRLPAATIEKNTTSVHCSQSFSLRLHACSLPWSSLHNVCTLHMQWRMASQPVKPVEVKLPWRSFHHEWRGLPEAAQLHSASGS
jgi:hypothetical protein